MSLEDFEKIMASARVEEVEEALVPADWIEREISGFTGNKQSYNASRSVFWVFTIIRCATRDSAARALRPSTS